MPYAEIKPVLQSALLVTADNPQTLDSLDLGTRCFPNYRDSLVATYNALVDLRASGFSVTDVRPFVLLAKLKDECGLTSDTITVKAALRVIGSQLQDAGELREAQGYLKPFSGLPAAVRDETSLARVYLALKASEECDQTEFGKQIISKLWAMGYRTTEDLAKFEGHNEAETFSKIYGYDYQQPSKDAVNALVDVFFAHQYITKLPVDEFLADVSPFMDSLDSSAPPGLMSIARILENKLIDEKLNELPRYYLTGRCGLSSKQADILAVFYPAIDLREGSLTHSD